MTDFLPETVDYFNKNKQHGFAFYKTEYVMKLDDENKQLKSDLKDYKDAATAEADQVDLLQKQNRELKEIIE